MKQSITVARKPFKGTVAANVLEHGTGAINVDGCRVPHGDDVDMALMRNCQTQQSGHTVTLNNPGFSTATYKPGGRWPANLIHDGSDEVVELFPHTTSGQLKTKSKASGWNGDGGKVEWTGACGDSGSAARFFYCAKANKKDREEGNSHPTVKPTELMRYLCRLVTPPGGVVLDPFMGSGSTGKAAVLEGFEFIGIEREAEYLEIARNRIELPAQGSLL